MKNNAASKSSSVVIAVGSVGGQAVDRLRELAGEREVKTFVLDFGIPSSICDEQDNSLKHLERSLAEFELPWELLFSVVHFSGHGSFVRDELVEIGEEISRETVKQVLSEPERLYKMTAIGFERFVAEIYRGLGYQVRSTKRSHDGGVDLYLDYNLHGMTQSFVVQCKYREAPKRAIGIAAARELLGTVVDKAATAGILVTNYLFSGATRKLIASHSSRLYGVDRLGLLDLMVMYLLATVS